MPGTYQYDVEIKSNVAKLLSDMKQVQDRLDTVEGKEYKIKLNVDEKKLSSVISNLEKMLDSLGKGTGDFKQFENLSKELSSIVSEVQNLSKSFGKVDDSGAKTLLSSIQNIDKSLSELSQNILNVNKNMSNMGGNTSGAVKQAENISNAYQDAAKEAEKLADAQSNIGQKTNISSASTPAIEQQNKLQKELKETQQQAENAAKAILKVTGYRGTNGGDPVTSNKSGATFWDSKKNVANMYGINSSDKTLWSSELSFNNPFTFDAKKQKYGDITYLGDGADYASREIIELTQRENELRKALDNSTKSGLEEVQMAYELQDVCQRIVKISKDTSNPYGTHSTDWFAEYAKNNGYDGVAIKNVLDTPDSYAKNGTEVSDVYITFQREQLQNTTLLAKANHELAESEREVALAELGVTQNQKKDVFPKTSENLEQVAQSEQKVQQEAVATDKALDNISFTPNTEGFNDIIAKFSILREQAEQITKIVKNTKQTTDGVLTTSYKATLKNGQTYTLGENSHPQVLNASETVYDSKAFSKTYDEAVQINNALNITKATLSSLQVPKGFEGSFENVKAEVEKLNKDLTSDRIGLKEYSDGIKNVFSGFDNSVGEKATQVWNQLTKSLDRYSTLQKRIANGKALSTDEQEATELLNVINELQRSDVLPADKLNASNEKLSQIRQNVADIKSQIAETTLDNVQSQIDKYTKFFNTKSIIPEGYTQTQALVSNLNTLQTAINKLEQYKSELNGVNELSSEQQAKLQGYINKCEEAATAIKNMSAAEKGMHDVSVQKNIDKINQLLKENPKYSKQAREQLQALLQQLSSGNVSVTNLRKIETEILKIKNAEEAAGRSGSTFMSVFKNKAIHGFIGQMASYINMYLGFYGMMRYATNAIKTIRELDTALVDLKKTTTMNTTQLNEFYYSANDVARQMGVTTEEIINQASAWSRLGYSSQEAATEMAKLSSQFASISPGMDTDQAQEGLVSIMKAWSIDPDQVKSEIMDPINKLGNTMALSNQDIVEGMKRSAAALAAVGTDYKDAFAMFSGIQEVLQNAEKSGTALRSIALRIRSFDESTEEYSDDLANITGELADLTKTAQHAQGVSVLKPGTNGEFKSLTEYFKEISSIWDEMTEKQQNDYLMKAFGRTQADLCLYVQKCA